MTQEEKQLLLKDLGSRLVYHPIIYGKEGISTNEGVLTSVTTSGVIINTKGGSTLFYFIEEIKPYFRPMSSMTEKEYETLPIPYSFDSFSTWNNTILSEVIEGTQILIGIDEITEIIDWLNEHHFDYRGLIGMGLAYEAPKGMY